MHSLPNELDVSSDSRTASTEHVECEVFMFEEFTEIAPKTPNGYKSIGTLVEELESDPHFKEELNNARKGLSSELSQMGEESLRSLRLKKGLSQSNLAALLGTSQSHIAKIEKGTQNIHITTCRKLCEALDIDLISLDRILRANEVFSDRRSTK